MLSASNAKVGLRSKFIFLIFSIFTVTFGFSQNCSGDLSVDKDRNVRSADQDGTQFSLTLKNTSTRSQTYTISSINLKESCATAHHKTTAPNVSLNVSFLDRSASPVNEISLAAGESKNFNVSVNVPEGTPFNTWSCIDVQAKACNSIAASTVLRVFVPDASEE